MAARPATGITNAAPPPSCRTRRTSSGSTSAAQDRRVADLGARVLADEAEDRHAAGGRCLGDLACCGRPGSSAGRARRCPRGRRSQSLHSAHSRSGQPWSIWRLSPTLRQTTLAATTSDPGRVLADREPQVAVELDARRPLVAGARQVELHDIDGEAVLGQHVAPGEAPMRYSRSSVSIWYWSALARAERALRGRLRDQLVELPAVLARGRRRRAREPAGRGVVGSLGVEVGDPAPVRERRARRAPARPPARCARAPRRRPPGGARSQAMNRLSCVSAGLVGRDEELGDVAPPARLALVAPRRRPRGRGGGR